LHLRVTPWALDGIRNYGLHRDMVRFVLNGLHVGIQAEIK